MTTAVPVSLASNCLGAFAILLVIASLIPFVPSPVLGDADGTWHLVAPPAPRIGLRGVYDPIGDRLIIFGGSGEDYAYHDDVWSVPLGGAATWMEIVPAGPGPGPRWDHSLIYDSTRRRLIAFGGHIGAGPGTQFPPYTYSNDVWSLQLDGTSSWMPIVPTLGPAPVGRTNHAAIFDPVRDRMIIFGGSESITEGTLSDVWALSLTSTAIWEQLPPSPVAQSGHSAVYDPLRDRMVVCGSQFSAGTHDVWALSLSGSHSWTKLPAPTTPSIPERTGATAIYDAANDRMVVFGGADAYAGYAFKMDVWAFPLGAATGWMELTPAGDSPGPRFAPAAVYDPIRAQMVATGGVYQRQDVWALSLLPGGQWTRVVPEPPQPATYRWGHAGVYDAPGQRMVIWAGFGVEAGDSDLWSLSLEGEPTWTRLNDPVSPGIRAEMVGVYDSRRRRMLIHGGGPAQTWGLALTDDLTWTQIAAVPVLPHHWADHVGVYDPLRDRLVVFGGDSTYCPNPDIPPCTGGRFREVWALNLEGTPAWTHIVPQGEPPPQPHGAAAIYDPRRDRMIVYGGAGVAGRTWALTFGAPPTWSMIAEPSSQSLVRENHTAIYDPVRDRMVTYAGSSSTDGSIRLDTWELQLSGTPVWRELATRAAPLARRWDHVAVYDPINGRMVVNSGYDTRTTYVLTWGDAPTEVLISVEPPMVTPFSVRLRWRIPRGEMDATVSRFAELGRWSELAQLLPDGSGVATFEDHDVRPGGRYGYRLAIHGQEEAAGGEVWVDVPMVPTVELRAVRNPSIGPIRVAFSLESSSPARLELFDVAGRLVDARDVGSMGPELTHELQFDELNTPPGMFIVRLAQRRGSRTIRVVRVR